MRHGANPPAAVAAVDWRDRQMDRRMPDRYMPGRLDSTSPTYKAYASSGNSVMN